jgi:predicted MFS family arabinose efflux permease
MDNTQQQLYDSPAYKRSRAAYKWECTFEYFVALLVSDAYLSNLLSYMGISDGTIGIISSLISFAFLFQLLAIFAVKHITNVKKSAIFFHFASQLLFMSLFLIPFLPIAKEYKTLVVFVCIIFAYLGNYLVTSIIFKWGMSFVDDKKRASFSATKEMISLISGIVFTFVVGYAVDGFAERGNVKGGFIFVASAILVSSLLDLTCLLVMKSPKPSKNEDRGEPILSVIKKLFKNKAFICILVTGMLLFSAQYLTNSFMGIYKTKDLLLTVGLVQLINIGGCLARFLLTKPIARYSDRRSYVKGVKLGMWIAVAGFLINMFTTPGLWWMVIVFTLIYNGSCAGTGQNMNNIVYSYVPEEYFVEASAIKNSVAGLCGFGASVVGGLILDAVQANGNQIFGITVYGQQLLSAISALILLVAIVFVSRVLEKQIIVAK